MLGRPLRGRSSSGRGSSTLEISATSSAGTVSSAGRSARIWSDRRCAIRIDARHRAILPPEVWGDGEPDGVRARAAERMKDTARAAARFGVTQVNGFTGSSIWHLLYSFPPNDFAAIDRGLRRVRRGMGTDTRRVRRRRRAVRTRGASDRDRVRLRHDAEGSRCGRSQAGFRHQSRPDRTSPISISTLPSSHSSSPIASTTSTSRTHESGSTDADRSSARTSTSATRRAAGTSSLRVTATWTSSRCSGR